MSPDDPRMKGWRVVSCDVAERVRELPKAFTSAGHAKLEVDKRTASQRKLGEYREVSVEQPDGTKVAVLREWKLATGGCLHAVKPAAPAAVEQ